MSIDMSVGVRRGLVLAVAAASISLVVAACNDTTSIDPQRDRIPPKIALAPVTGQPDTVIAFTTDATDNLGLKTVHVRAVGAASGVFDTTFTSAVTTFSIGFKVFSSRATPPSMPIC